MLLVGLAAVAVACTDKTADTAASTASPVIAATDLLTVAREGYEGLPDSIGDPAAVVLTNRTGPVVTYAGEPVVQACGLVTPQDIRAAGGLLWPNPLDAGIERRFFDGQGQAPVVDPGRFVLPFDTNQCHYTLAPDTNRGAVRVSVYQPGYAGRAAIEARPTGMTQAPPIGPVTIYTAAPTRAASNLWALTHGSVLVELEITNTTDKVRQALLTVAAQRLAELVAHPAGPARFGYDSPAFPVEYGNACEVAGNPEFRALFNIDAGALATERVASAVGVITFGTPDKPAPAVNYVTHSCTRQAADPVATPQRQRSFTVIIDTYEHPAAAQAAFARARSLRPNQVSVPTTVGEETLYSSQPGLDDVLSFRTGRLVVLLHYQDPTHPNTAAQERIRLLTPIGQTISDRLGAVQ